MLKRPNYNRPDTPLAATPDAEYTPQAQTARNMDNRIVRGGKQKDEERKNEILKQVKSNKVQEEKSDSKSRDSRQSINFQDSQK